jgi:glycosyltransferase involved in cell wall biosynthesis
VGSKACRLLYATPYPVESLAELSGTNHFIFESIKNRVAHCHALAPMQEKRPLTQRALSRLPKKLFPWRFLQDHTRQNAKCLSNQVEAVLRQQAFDALFSPTTLPVMTLGGTVPVCIYTDASVACLVDYYAEFSGVFPPALRTAHALEQQAFRRADKIVFTSQWACDITAAAYGVPPEKLSWVPRGANFTSGMDEADAYATVNKRPRDRCSLLFVGADWERKGGKVALEATRLLCEAGLPTQLHVVGCNPDLSPNDRNLATIHGYLRKTVSGELEQLRWLYQNSHFFVLPTNAEAMGISFCEASSFALPSIAPDTGGVGAAVRTGVNGVLLPRSAAADDYAKAALELFRDKDRYEGIARSAYALYKSELNWGAVGERLADILAELT